MTIESFLLRRVAVTEEASDAFAVDVTASATYRDVPVQEGTATLALTQPMLDPQIMQQRLDARSLLVRGVKSAELSITVPLGATGVAAGDGATSPAYTAQGLLYLLKILYGGANDENVGDTAISSANTYTITPTTTTVFDGGECLGWVGAGGFEARSLVSGAATIALRDQLSASPSGTDVLYAGTTIHPTANPLTSVQMIVEGAEQDDRWLLMGGQVTGAPSISLTHGEIPTMTFQLTFANWAKEPVTAITVADYSTFTPVAWTGGVRAINGAASGSISGACLDAASVDLAFSGPMYVAARSGCGTNTIKRWVRQRAVPFATVNLVLPYEDSSWLTERDDQEYYGIHIQIGSVAGSTVLIDIPKLQVTNAQPTDNESLAYQTVTFESTTDSYATQADDDDIRYAAFRLHFL